MKWIITGIVLVWDRVLLELSGARTKRVQNPNVYDEILKLRVNYP
jgi:hypothetical protein